MVTVLEEVVEWAEENVKHPIDHCFFYSGTISLIFGVPLMMGPGLKEGETHHFWNIVNGEIFDATNSQYENGYPYYDQGKVVSAIRNIDEIINDPLFKTLGNIDQMEINQIYKLGD